MNDKAIHAETSPTLVSPERLVGRREFVTLAGLSAAMLGLEGCIRRPEEKILPYTMAPEYTVPGVPLHFATVLNCGGEAVGVLVESHEGRPTKIEGNPEHPASLGGTDASLQADLLNLYDTDRSRGVHIKKASKGGGQESLTKADWEQFERFLKEALSQWEREQGKGLAFLSRPSRSMTEQLLQQAVRARFPQARFVHSQPCGTQQSRQGAELAFGKPLQVHYAYAKAQVVLSIDSDFMHTEPGKIKAMRGFADSRRVYSESDRMSRLYVVESTATLTGINADHRLCLKPNDIERYLKALALELVEQHGLVLPGLGEALKGISSEGIAPQWIKAVAKDLIAARQHSIITVGAQQPARVHALGHALNVALLNVGQTVTYTQSLEEVVQQDNADLRALVSDMRGGKISTLFILDANPVYDAPADLKFKQALAQVQTVIHLGSHVDETALECQWHLPLAHPLETWGDLRSLDGTWAIQQPLIAPLFGGRSAIELWGLIANQGDWRGYAAVRTAFRQQWANVATSWEQGWRQALHAGIVPNTAWPVQPVSIEASGQLAEELRKIPAHEPVGEDALQVVFGVDSLDGGRNANNPWLLELPHPVTKMCWDNAAWISANTAKALNLSNEDMVQLYHPKDGRAANVAVWIQPGMADFTVAVALGWGRTKAGRYGNGCGFNAYPLRHSDALRVADGFKIKRLGRTYSLTRTQEYTDMEGRPLAISDTFERYLAQPDFPQYASVEPNTGPLWKEKKYNDHKWGMSIDMNACAGCGACVIACQSENNVATVGKEEVRKGREMQWLRIDHYYEASNDDFNSVFQPVACQHCEEAPCENVCPVNATTHSPEGLNDMAYNRCIGTRYCANNCPYKVRRFNYLNYQGEQKFLGKPNDVKQMQFNPDVTVRMRGVMEKCTYCVQRIQEAKIKSRVDNAPLKDGDVTPACAQACPSQAIVFGDMNDKASQVAKLAKQKRGYHLLAEVGTQPRTRYLAKLRNINPEMRS